MVDRGSAVTAVSFFRFPERPEFLERTTQANFAIRGAIADVVVKTCAMGVETDAVGMDVKLTIGHVTTRDVQAEIGSKFPCETSSNADLGEVNDIAVQITVT